MNPLNFKFLQVPAVLFYTFPTGSKSKRKEQNITALVRLSLTVILIDKLQRFRNKKKRLENKKNVKNVKNVTKIKKT